MTQRLVAFLSLLFGIAGCASHFDIERPLKTATVGDYAVFRGKSFQGDDTMRQEVTAIVGINVTVKTTMLKDNIETNVFEQTFTRDKSCDLISQAISRGEKIVDAGGGQETLKINDREYKCEYRWYSFHVGSNGKEDVAETKVWISADAPVYGMVKSQTTVRGTVIHMMELAESSKK